MDLHVDEAGDPNRPAILFLHGSPLSGRMWAPQLAGLAADFHCLAPDLPEHGRSAGIGPFQMHDAVRRLTNLIARSAAHGRAHVVGLSFGGVVAQALMAEAPDRVGHVILSGTAGRLSPALLGMLKLQVELNRPLLKRLPPSLLARLMRWQFGLPRSYDAALAEDLASISGDALVRFITATYSDIVTPQHAGKPTLVVVGGRETPFAQWQARQLTRAIAGARGVRAPGLGHVWNLQNPRLFNMMVKAWLFDHPLPTELISL
jgi:pimeloyl-ACP methyl ester carboxylesterase